MTGVRLRPLLAAAGMLLAVAPVCAHPALHHAELLAPLGDVVLAHSPLPPPPGGPVYYAASGETARWNIAQWDIPGGDLPPFATAPGNGAGTSVSAQASAAVAVERRKTGVSVLLMQNGRSLACKDAQGQYQEFDLLLAPNNTVRTPAMQLGLLRNPSIPTGLDALAALRFSAHVTLGQRPVSDLTRCADNSGSALLALILVNDHTPPRQTLFYQLSLNAFCARNSGGRLLPCGRLAGVLRIFSPVNPYGFDDDLPLLGHAWMQDGDSATLNLDLLPRLRTVLAQAPAGMDHDPSHWRFETAYVGQHIWGDVTMATQWRDLRLDAFW